MARLTPPEETTPADTPVEPVDSTAGPDSASAGRKARKRTPQRATEKAAAKSPRPSGTTVSDSAQSAGEAVSMSAAAKPPSRAASKAPTKTASEAAAGPPAGAPSKAPQKAAPDQAPKAAPDRAPKAAANRAPKAGTGTTGATATASAGHAGDNTANPSTGAPRSAAQHGATGTPVEKTQPADVSADAPEPAAAAADGESVVATPDPLVAQSRPTNETTSHTTSEIAEGGADGAAEDGAAGDRAVARDTLTGGDQARRTAVVAAEVFCVVGTLVGVGVLGTRVEESSGGALAADATLIAPAGPAFSIWTPIYLGLLGYTIWQALPSNATRERTRATGWLAAASMVLNAVWLLVTQQGWIWLSVVVIALLAAVLGTLVSRLTRERASGAWERVLVDVTFGTYLGWVSVATAANVTAALVQSGVDLGSVLNQVAAVLVVAVAALIGVFLASGLGGRWSVAGAMAWGLGWIAVGRFTDEPRSVVTGIAAAAAAVAVLAAAARFRSRGVVYHGRHS
ncbi:TspO/MBR family protein [Intrasporangium oryzae]|uniref:TspO/MBR family protein n=1 Tax=Intrasporangium oryzae TaxID=412687 RepID=UPI001FE22331|nr:TspO/MBR family protein [Intrasporangium oryzae]